MIHVIEPYGTKFFQMIVFDECGLINLKQVGMMSTIFYENLYALNNIKTVSFKPTHIVKTLIFHALRFISCGFYLNISITCMFEK